MKELKKEEMKKIDGGTSSIIVSSIIGVIITFLIGVFHGYNNPESCRN